MMNRKRNTIVAVGNLACVAVIVAMTGCGSDEPEAVVATYKPPPLSSKYNKVSLIALTTDRGVMEAPVN